jgi:GNAT superfamily N-acetyltransferase
VKAHSEVLRAGEDDLDVLSQVIADAFYDLPAARWLIADPDIRRQIFPRYFRLFVEHAQAHGTVHTTADRSAAALWIYVAGGHTTGPADYDSRLAAVTGPFIDRFIAFDTALDRRHPVGVRYHHLAMLAVRPDRQGEGIGTALLRSYHEQLDQQVWAPAYLEAADQRTRRLYLRHGYADHGPPIRLPDGPFMYPMWRAGPSLSVRSGRRHV